MDYPHHVPSLFRRRSQTAEKTSADAAATESSAEPGAGLGSQPASAEHVDGDHHADAADNAPRAGVKPAGYTPGKGRPTPKRRDQRRRSAEPPPKDRKEAYRRMRERQKTERIEARQAMMQGDERYLPARDRGPDRALARDIVDARRNIGTWFFAGAVVILIGTWPGVAPQLRVAFDLLWVVLLIAVIVDSAVLGRLVRRLVNERNPDSRRKWAGLYFYAIMRSLTMRRMRIPKPRVSIGDAI